VAGVIKPKIESALNNQMNKEFYSSYLYLAMAAHFEAKNMKGFAHWMRVQSQEEYGHAMKIYNYLVERAGKIALTTIEPPPATWKTHREVFEDAYKHEQTVSESINGIVDLAKSEKDHATEVFLQWFVSEQVEEEATASMIVEKLKLAGEGPGALLILDSELGKRASSS